MNEFRMPNPEEVRDVMAVSRRERAAVYAAGVRKAAGFVVGVVRAVAGAFAEAKRQRALYEDLSRMSDKELRDIGLNRADIPAVVAGVYTGGEATAETGPTSGPDKAPVPSRTDGERLAA